MCLMTDNKTEKSANFFKNNLLNSNIWSTNPTLESNGRYCSKFKQK